jgi:Tfp pilus assembly PilM family ATPase
MPNRRALFSEGISSLVTRRILVIDHGTEFLKILTAESRYGRVRVLRQDKVDVIQEGIHSAEDLQQHLEKVLPQLTSYQVGLVVAQHRCITQVVDLPQGGKADLAKTAEAEAARLLGLADTPLQLDWVQLKPFAQYSNPCLLTVCRASDVAVQAEILRTGDSESEEPAFGEMTCGAQALASAAQHLSGRPGEAVIVDLGANSTTVAVVRSGQLVFATSLALGSHQFTEVISRQNQCSLEAAENLKRSENFFTNLENSGLLTDAVKRWFGQVRQVMGEWAEDNAESEVDPASYPLYLCGGGAQQPGLIAYVNTLGPSGVKMCPSPMSGCGDEEFSPYWMAYGVAQQYLQDRPGSLSLLPAAARQARSRDRVWRRLQTAVLVSLCLAGLVMSVGTWQKSSLIMRKKELSQEVEAVLDTSKRLEMLSRRLDAKYARISPVMNLQRRTVETLQALSIASQFRTNRDCWYVVFGDSLSYAAGTTLPVLGAPLGTDSGVSTNPPPAVSRREFIAEICIVQGGEATRRVLNQVVAELRTAPLFSKVDALPPDRKRNLVDPKVVITNQVFALAMELAGYDSSATGGNGLDRPHSMRDPRTGRTVPRAKGERVLPGPTNY